MSEMTPKSPGAQAMTDPVIAADLLISAKANVRSYAYALAEAASPEVRNVLRRHLQDAINLHEQVTNYMIEKNWYKAYDVPAQIQADLQNAQTALNLR